MSPPIFTPDGSEVSEIVLPDGSTASEVIGPDGNVVFEAGPDIPDSENLQSHWPVNEGSGATVTDVEGANDGTITGADWVNDTELGQDVLDFPNSGDEVSMGDLVGGYTEISAIILTKANNVGGTFQAFITQMSSTNSNRAFEIFISTDDTLRFSIVGVGFVQTSASDLNGSDWTMLSLAYSSGGTIEGWIDKTSVGTVSATGSLNSGGDFQIGNTNGFSRPAQGRCAEGWLWNSRLDQNDIEAMYDLLLG